MCVGTRQGGVGQRLDNSHKMAWAAAPDGNRGENDAAPPAAAADNGHENTFQLGHKTPEAAPDGKSTIPFNTC